MSPERSATRGPAPSPIGDSTPRLEDGPLLRGAAAFIADLRTTETLHVAFLRSPIAHARITSVDLAQARAHEGVIAAFGGAEIHEECQQFTVHLTTPGAIAPARSLLAQDKLRYVGEPIAVAIARDRYLAEDAVELIEVDYEPLPVVADSASAVQPDAELVHEIAPGNVYFRLEKEFGDVDAAFAAAEVVIEESVTHPRVAPAPMECRGVVAVGTDEGGVKVWSSTQCPHLVAEAIAECCGLPEELVRVVTPDIGGGFGVKAHVYTEEVTVAWLALKLGRPIIWIEDRIEHLQAANHARDQSVAFRAAIDADGVVLGLEARIVSNIGAYGIRPHGPLLDPMTTAGLVVGPYMIENYRYETIAVATNRCPEGPDQALACPPRC